LYELRLQLCDARTMPRLLGHCADIPSVMLASRGVRIPVSPLVNSR
jgi:hypothetical protein